ncbi:hypothetical protein ACFL1X_08735 [Candidatus Hydrogenedentota bacterium]
MKQSPQMDKIQHEMRPGGLTRDGLLGGDRRKLIEILTDDDELVKRLGQSHKNIARRMQELRDAGMKGLGNFVAVSPDIEVRVDSIRGKLPCPFTHPGIYRKTNITVRNTRLREVTIYTDLNVHMIEEHGFYEGRGAVFRLEPKDLIAILEIARSVSD